MICVYLFYFSFILVLYLHFVRNKRNNNNNNNNNILDRTYSAQRFFIFSYFLFFFILGRAVD